MPQKGLVLAPINLLMHLETNFNIHHFYFQFLGSGFAVRRDMFIAELKTPRTDIDF